MAFEGDIDHWLHPSLWYVDVRPQALPHQELIDRVQRQFAPARVGVIQIFRQKNLAEAMQMTDRSLVLVNPYDGTVSGHTTGPSSVQRSEEHTSELQSLTNLVCRLLLEKKNKDRSARLSTSSAST